MNLVMTEMRRALRRRAVRVLIVIALVGCAAAGVIAYLASSGHSLTELRSGEDGSPAILTDWWIAGQHEGFLVFAVFFLLLGGFFGGATVAGGEWRAGTVTTVLTWEPRRLRLHAARSVSAGALAFAISLLLQVLFLGSFLPAVVVNGSADGADRSFWIALTIVMARTSAITGAGAVIALGLATVARNTAFAVIVMFTWLVVVEGLIRGLRPSLSRWLWGENLGTVLTWSQLPDAGFTRSPLVACSTLLAYGAVIVGCAAASFHRRDIAGPS